MPTRRLAALLIAVGVLRALARGPCGSVAAEEPAAARDRPPKLHIPLPTLGGKQFWTDHLLLDQWRIQGNSVTGQFGIVAGGKGNDTGFNPLLEGDDDGTVTVASTRLAGARDFVLVPALHSFIMNHSKVLDYTLRFLQKGYFVAPGRDDE